MTFPLKAIVLFALALSTPLPASQTQDQPYNAEIVRDEYGVPHIHGRTDADTAYGLAFVAAERNFAVLQDLLAVARGQSGLLHGKSGAIRDYGRELLNIPATVEHDYDEIPADARAMLEAYAAGINRYAALHPKQVRNAKLFPASGRDVAAGYAMVSLSFYGIDEELGKLFNNQLPGAAPASSRPASSPPPDKGSNAFAIAPAKMADGKTWLIANPHLPYEGYLALFEAVVHSDEGLDMAGATLLGSPFLLVGHNRNLGWAVTLNNPDLIDVYRLTLNAKGDQYLFDGKWLPLVRRPVKLPVKAGIISIIATREVVSTVHGPVVFNRHGAFAIRYAGMNSLRMIEQTYRQAKAQNWADWQKVMEIGGIPSTNYVYADRTGKIAYIYNGLIPDRKAGFDYAGVLPGDTSASVWQNSVGFARLPKVIDPPSGFVFSANNAPFHATAPDANLQPQQFAPEMGIETRMTNRSWRAEELLSASGKLTPEALLAIKFDTGYSRQSYVMEWIDRLLAVDTSDRPDLAEAQALLKTWDWNSDSKGAADALAELVIMPAKFANYHRYPAPDPKIVLDAYVKALAKTYGRIDPPLSNIISLQRGETVLPSFGGADTLRTATVSYSDNKGTLRVGGGDSFIMLINWDQQGRVSSQSIVPYGSSIDPASPHYADQMPLFVGKRFKPVHFEWSDAVAHGGKAYRP